MRLTPRQKPSFVNLSFNLTKVFINKAKTGAAISQILAKLSRWTGQKALTWPCNTELEGGGEGWQVSTTGGNLES
jgi:hypothetical protein